MIDLAQLLAEAQSALQEIAEAEAERIEADRHRDEWMRRHEEMERVGLPRVTADLEGAILTANPPALHLFGYDKEAELVGQNITRLMPHTFHEPHLRGLKRFRDTGEARILGKHIRAQGLRRDGTAFPVVILLAAHQSITRWVSATFIDPNAEAIDLDAPSGG